MYSPATHLDSKLGVASGRVTPEMAAAADGALIGHSIDERYCLEGVIGVGGLGSVYRATHTKLNRPVAVKLLHESFGESQVQRGRFEREAKALAALQHPNIVAVLDYGVSGLRPYLVMELLEGETLSQRLHRGPLSVEVALQVVQQLLEALSFMHRAQLVHRDVKPSNVFLQRMRDGQDRVKVLDLGLAKFTTPAPLASGDPTLTRDGAILGTPAYMSPEQATGEAVDARSDVYAVGVILFRMLAGRLPFGGDAIEQVRSHLIAPVPALERAEPEPELDEALEALIRRAMTKRREDRFDDAGQMLRALVEAFPQFVRATLPQHEHLPDPFAVDAINAEWLLSEHEGSSEVPTLEHQRRLRMLRGESALRNGVQRVGRAMKALFITSVRLFAGVSVLLVIGTGAIFIFLLRDEADRAELNALQRRVSDRLIERSLGSAAGARAETSHLAVKRAEPDVLLPAAAGAGAEPLATNTRALPADREPVPVESPAPSRALSPASPPAADDHPLPLGTVAPAAIVPPDPAPQPSAAGPVPLAPTPDFDTASVAGVAELAAAFPKPGPEVGAATAAIHAVAPPEARASAGGPTAPQLAAASASTGRADDEGANVPARSPWQEPVPSRLRLARKIALNGGRGGDPLLNGIRDYNKVQRSDPRGHLLLGQLYMNRFWRADALSQFSIALQLDPSARGAPEVLEGLLKLVVHGGLASESERVILQRYGEEARLAVERVLAAQEDPKVIARLKRLAARLELDRP